MKKKKNLIVLLLLFDVVISNSQIISKGWFYYKTPTTNVFGVGYLPIKKDKDISWVGSSINVSENELIVYTGPDTSSYIDEGFRKIVITSLFQNSKSPIISVKASNLKRVVLPGGRWGEFDTKNYYVIEALRADRVVISAKVSKETKVDSKDAEKLVSVFVPATAVAFKVVDALTNKEGEGTGILAYKTGRNDSFSVVITNPNIYFASKFVQVSSNAIDAYWRRPACAPFKHDSVISKVKYNGTPLMTREFLNLHANGVNLKLTANHIESATHVKYFSLILTVNVRGLAPDKQPKPIVIEQAVDDGSTPITFDGEHPYITDPRAIGYSKSEKYLTLIDYKIDFDPKTKNITVHGYEDINGQSTYQTCIYQIKNELTYWPK